MCKVQIRNSGFTCARGGLCSIVFQEKHEAPLCANRGQFCDSNIVGEDAVIDVQCVDGFVLTTARQPANPL